MLYWNTVAPRLKESLLLFMQEPIFTDFRLVGGTALSLYKGHRMSVDIDLFTDRPYGKVDFGGIDAFLQQKYAYVDSSFGVPAGMGRSYLIGSDDQNNIKLDVFYSLDNFLQPPHKEDGIRMASVEDIIAMKMDVVARGGRKKDFWDLHELMDDYSLLQMIALHKARAEYTHNEVELRKKLVDFSGANEDFNPNCLRGKQWEFIKEDIEDFVAKG